MDTKTQKFGLSQKIGPMFKVVVRLFFLFFVKNRTYV